MKKTTALTRPGMWITLLSIAALLASTRSAIAQNSANQTQLPLEFPDKPVPKSYPVLSGVGLALMAKDGHIVVGKLIPQTPAAESGQITEGARIVSIEVDGKELHVENKTVGDVVSLIRGPVGTKLVLGILSPEADAPIKVTLVRAPLEIEGVPDSTYEKFIGKPMTKLAFSSLDGGESETLADYRGKVVVLDFWASWCPACYQPVTQLQKLVADNPSWKGKVEAIAVTVDAEVDKALAVVKEKEWNKTRHRAANHDKLMESGISVLPVVMIVAADGTVAAMAGAHALDVEKEVERLLSAGRVPILPGEEDLQDQVDRIGKEIGAVVGIELKGSVPAERISGDDYRKILRSQIDTLLPHDRIAETLRSWQLLGLLPDVKIDFEQLLDLTATTSGATYNPETKSIQLTPGSAKTLSDENAFHELVHAAQDQRHDLKRIHKQLGTLPNTDAMIAFKFLLEGEAVFWQTLYRRKLTLDDVLRLSPDSLTQIFGDEKVLTSQEMIRNFDEGGKRNPRLKVLGWTMRLLPPLISRSLSLSYSKGDNAALRLVKRGGREAMRQSYEDVSKLNTRDILFPDPPNEKPRGVLQVQLGKVDDKLGGHWKLKHEDTLGALVLNTMFEVHVDQAAEIAKSWNGDRIQLWEDEDGGVALLGRVELETVDAAKLFEAELIGLCREKWMRGNSIRELETDGTHLAADANHFVLDRRERSVVFSRSSGCKNAASVTSALWGNEGRKVSAIGSSRLTPIDISAFRSGIHHWRDLRDTSRFIQVERSQPSYAVRQVREIVNNILLFQRENGGWPKDYDMTAILSAEQLERVQATRANTDTSYDNGNIHSQVEYLARAVTQVEEPVWRAACERGLDFVLRSQYAHGGFPQRYPNARGFPAHITFNDGVMIGALNLLQDAAGGVEHFQWLDRNRRQRAQDAVERGVACILRCQIQVEGQLTGWCQQHDENSFEPRAARSFELASICPQETTEIVRFLMRQPAPSPSIVRAVDGAVAWLQKSRLQGIRIEKVKSTPVSYLRHDTDLDVVVVADANARPIWARHYEIGSDRPIFAGRDGIKKYELAQIERERRTGTPWYGSWPQSLIDRDYPAWRSKLAE